MFCRAIAEGWKGWGEGPCAGRHAIRKCVAGALHYPPDFWLFWLFRCATVQRLLSDSHSLRVMFDLPNAKR